MARNRRPPKSLSVRVARCEYELDLVTLHRALESWRRRPDVGTAPLQMLASRTNLSRCTVWRFVSGRPVGLMATRRITHELGLSIEDVLKPVIRPRPAEAHRASAEAALAWLRELETWLVEVSELVERLKKSDQD